VTAVVRLGTRASALARWQTDRVMRAIAVLAPELHCEPALLDTRGDSDRVTPIAALGEVGVFTDALERALLAGEIDFAVHSLKDLPIEERPGLTIAAVCLREDVRDALVAAGGLSFASLPRGARVGTSSLRRRAQLLAARRDLEVVSLRGNVDTRVRRALEGDLHAVVLAAAGLHRLDMRHVIAEYFDTSTMVPAPGQGALAIQCRSGDVLLALLTQLDEPGIRPAVTAERAFLAAIGGGCSAPVGAWSEVNGELTLTGMVADPDGRHVIRVRASGPVEGAERLGRRAAEQALALGAGALLP